MYLTKRIKREVIEFTNSSIFILNASGADCYIFSLYHNKKGKVDFEGGWDWTDHHFFLAGEYMYILKTGKFMKIKRNNEN